MSATTEVPIWYFAEMQRLFSYISGPLCEIHPSWSDAELDQMTRALFLSVHGIVLLGVENRLSAVPRAAMEEMIDLILRRVIREKFDERRSRSCRSSLVSNFQRESGKCSEL